SPQLRPRLDGSLVLEGGLSGSQYPADRVSGDPEVPCDLLDCLALDEVLAPNPRNCFHDQHPLTPAPNQSGKSARAHTSGGQFWTPIPRLTGSILHAETHSTGQQCYEQDFRSCSYGFRPERSAHQALRTLHSAITRHGQYWVLDIDVRKYLDPVSYCPLVHEARSKSSP